jgi:hypothetical protein
MAQILIRVVDRYDIRKKAGQFFSTGTSLSHIVKVGWFTADNATNNDSALKHFGKIIDPFATRWQSTQRRIR